MSVTTVTPIQTVQPKNQVVRDSGEDDSPSQKVDKAKLRREIAAVFQKPCQVNTAQLVHEAIFGQVTPFDSFNPGDFLSNIRK